MQQGLSWVSTHKRIIAMVFLVVVGMYGAYKPIPAEIGMHGPQHAVHDSSVQFLVDETYLNGAGERVALQAIFDEVLRLIEGAERYIVVDMFLWNPFQGSSPETHRALSTELTDALIAKKRANPAIDIAVISDPLNTVYDGQPAYHFGALEDAGIPVVYTDHGVMRDSNPLYSALWRGFFQWPDHAHQVFLGESYTFRVMPNLLDAGGEPVPIRSYLKLLNFKANHRKLIVADAPHADGRTMVTLVTSANPHDGSSMHSNVALRIEGGIWRDVVHSEAAVAAFSGGALPRPPEEVYREVAGDVNVSFVTERAIRELVLTLLARADEGDEVALAMFYLSKDSIIDALIDAARRGAEVRVILDPNKDAFGMEKDGVPNRPVAAKLVRASEGAITVRWCATHGEQCHSKLLLVAADGAHALTLGSANFTRRNLNNLNLEANVYVTSEEPSTAYTDALAYFDRMWVNADGRLYTRAYDEYRDDAWVKRVRAWVMERTGLSTF